MSIHNQTSTIPEDLITPEEARRIAGVNRPEWCFANRYRPEDFPTNYTNKGGKYGRYSRAEIIAFFSRFKSIEG
ncbi:hypothetical protein J4061_004462 [Salmonella enterica]|nr:hypothetical protein [Salmonella enterica]